MVQRLVIPEYDSYGTDALGQPITLGNPVEIRENHFFTYGFEVALGVAWMRRVKTQVAWRLEQINFQESIDPLNPNNTMPTPATRGGLNGIGRLGLTFDFRAREFAVMTGTSLGMSLDSAGPNYKGDFTYWRAGAGWEQGIKFFRAHNLIYSFGATVGHNLPFWNENTAGGPNLRGYLFQQFRGDSQLQAHGEYHFPLFSISSLDFRALAFYDAQAIWWRDLPPTGIMQYSIRDTPDHRAFLVDMNGVQQGFDFSRDIHQSVGAGLRFFLRSVAVPLVGFDAGWGIESRTWRFTLIIGA
jgi:hypothetical protein